MAYDAYLNSNFQINWLSNRFRLLLTNSSNVAADSSIFNKVCKANVNLRVISEYRDQLEVWNIVGEDKNSF